MPNDTRDNEADGPIVSTHSAQAPRRALPLLATALAGCAAAGPVAATPTLAQQPVRVFLSQAPRGPTDPIRGISAAVDTFLWSADVPSGPELRYRIGAPRPYAERLLPPGRLLAVDLAERLDARAAATALRVVEEAGAGRAGTPAPESELPLVVGTERYERSIRTTPIDTALWVLIRINFEISDISARLPVPLGPGEHLLSVIESFRLARANNQHFPGQSFADVVFVRGTVPEIEAGLLDRAALLTRRALEVVDLSARL